jgi:8-oxo-dGTP diphosphatase
VASSNSARPSTTAYAARSARRPASTFEPVALTGVYKNMTWGIIALVFRCKITGGDLATTDEVAAFRWTTDADIAELADEAYAVRVLDALHDEHPPAIRQHDGVHLL